MAPGQGDKASTEGGIQSAIDPDGGQNQGGRGAYLTTEEYSSISLKIHALGDLVIGEQYRHDDLATTMALGQGRSGNDLPKHSGDDLTKHYVNRGFIKHPPL